MSYLLIGLGNPGEKYKNTRHNAGKRFVEAFANTEYRILNTEWKQVQYAELIECEQWILAKPTIFMNESGKAVADLLSRYHVSKIQNSAFSIQYLFVAHDDLDIPLGKFKIQFGKGSKLHKGILSVEQALGTKEFWRIRIGIENRLKGQKVDRLKNEDSGEDYVLERFSAEEKRILEAVFPEIRKKLLENVIL